MKILLESLKKASEKLTKCKELKSDEKAIKKIEESKVEISLIKMKTLPENANPSIGYYIFGVLCVAQPTKARIILLKTNVFLVKKPFSKLLN